MLGNPTGPVWRGEIQCRGLGLNVEVCDDEGKPVRGREGRAGLHRTLPLACRSDSGTTPTAQKYCNAYFERFPDVWCHGDYVELTEHGGMIIYGRSDAMLNPGGVRIGTAEIYRQVEQLPRWSRASSSARTGDGRRRASCCSCACGRASARRARWSRSIAPADPPQHHAAPRAGEDPRRSTDIPRTKSGKIVELAVRDVVHGRAVKNSEALANPEALELYRDRERKLS